MLELRGRTDMLEYSLYQKEVSIERHSVITETAEAH